jgi:hypothetical protein
VGSIRFDLGCGFGYAGVATKSTHPHKNCFRTLGAGIFPYILVLLCYWLCTRFFPECPERRPITPSISWEALPCLWPVRLIPISAHSPGAKESGHCSVQMRPGLGESRPGWFPPIACAAHFVFSCQRFLSECRVSVNYTRSKCSVPIPCSCKFHLFHILRDPCFDCSRGHGHLNKGWLCVDACGDMSKSVVVGSKVDQGEGGGRAGSCAVCCGRQQG